MSAAAGESPVLSTPISIEVWKEAYQLSLLFGLFSGGTAFLLGADAVIDYMRAHQYRDLAHDDPRNLPRLAAGEQAVLELSGSGVDVGDVSLELCVFDPKS